MKTINISGILAIGLISLILFSCESHEKKADGYVQSKYSIKVSQDEKNGAKEKKASDLKVKKIVTPKGITSEWMQFRLDTERKIASNDLKIKKIKANPKTSQKMARQLSDLEETNNELKLQLDLFNNEVIAKWENFKTSMNHNVKEIEIELEGLSSK